jgi:hypothetical protein
MSQFGQGQKELHLMHGLHVLVCNTKFDSHSYNYLGIDINIETKCDSYYDKHLNLWHQISHYNQMYKFVFNNDHNF